VQFVFLDHYNRLFEQRAVDLNHIPNRYAQISNLP